MYRRRRFRRFKKKRYIPRRKRGGGLSKKVSYLMKQNKQNRPSLEFEDMNEVNQSIWTTPIVVKIEAGPSSKTIKSIQMKGKVHLAVSAATIEYARVVIFTDKSNESGAIPAWTDLYTSANVNSLRAISETKNEGQRFKILYDRTFGLMKDSDGTNKDSYLIKLYKKLNIKSINGTNDLFWEKGGLYLAYMSTMGEEEMDLDYNIRVGGKRKDIGYVIKNIDEERDFDTVLIDIDRASSNFVSYGAIEEIKNGNMMCNKYESCNLMFNTPHIIVFANFPPNEFRISKDRWVIREIKSDYACYTSSV